jgi:hypothetical protein
MPRPVYAFLHSIFGCISVPWRSHSTFWAHLYIAACFLFPHLLCLCPTVFDKLGLFASSKSHLKVSYKGRRNQFPFPSQTRSTHLFIHLFGSSGVWTQGLTLAKASPFSLEPCLQLFFFFKFVFQIDCHDFAYAGFRLCSSYHFLLSSWDYWCKPPRPTPIILPFPPPFPSSPFLKHFTRIINARSIHIHKYSREKWIQKSEFLTGSVAEWWGRWSLKLERSGLGSEPHGSLAVWSWRSHLLPLSPIPFL